MRYIILLGIPEMEAVWENLKEKIDSGTAKKNETKLYNKWGKAMKQLSEDPFYPGLHSHEIDSLSKRYGMKVFESYLENKKSRAMRMFWVYGPEKNQITIIALEPHPENKKKDAYHRINLDKLPS